MRRIALPLTILTTLWLGVLGWTLILKSDGYRERYYTPDYDDFRRGETYYHSASEYPRPLVGSLLEDVLTPSTFEEKKTWMLVTSSTGLAMIPRELAAEERESLVNLTLYGATWSELYQLLRFLADEIGAFDHRPGPVLILDAGISHVAEHRSEIYEQEFARVLRTTRVLDLRNDGSITWTRPPWLRRPTAWLTMSRYVCIQTKRRQSMRVLHRLGAVGLQAAQAYSRTDFSLPNAQSVYLERIAMLTREHEIDLRIVGNPINSVFRRSRIHRRFAALLEQECTRLNIPLAKWFDLIPDSSFTDGVHYDHASSRDYATRILRFASDRSD